MYVYFETKKKYVGINNDNKVYIFLSCLNIKCYVLGFRDYYFFMIVHSTINIVNVKCIEFLSMFSLNIKNFGSFSFELTSILFE